MRRRALAVVAATSLLVAGGGGGPAAPTPSGEPSTPASDETSSDTPTPAAGGSDGPDEASYLPVPEGRTLTEPGTALRLRDGALVAWEPRQDLVGVVGIKVLRIERTTVKRSLAGFQLDEAQAASTPYFVTAEVGNGGDTDLGGRQLPLYAVDSADRLVAPTGVDQGFEPCKGSLLPAVFAPGDAARTCLIFLVPQGAELDAVMFRPPEGVIPITWAGKIKKLSERGGPKGETRPAQEG